jgi:hypothetical protein
MMDLETLGSTNAEGCAACGSWKGGAKLIHENEAVFNCTTSQYYEKKCFNSRHGKP